MIGSPFRRLCVVCSAGAIAVWGMAAAHAGDPSPNAKHFLDAYRASLSRFDPSAAVCGAADAKAAAIQTFLTRATDGLSAVQALRTTLTEEEAKDPAVAAAVAKVDAANQCTERLRTALGGPAVAVASVVKIADGARATAEDFIASVDPGARADMAMLVAYKLGETATTAAAGIDGEAVARVLGEADQIAPLCVGRFAAVVKGAPPSGEVAADANPWGWCDAIASKADVAKSMVKDVAGRGLAALTDVTATVEGAVAGAAHVAASKVDEVWGAAGDLFAKARDMGAAYVAAGIAIPAEVASAIDKADAVTKKAATKVGKQPAELTAALKQKVEKRRAARVTKKTGPPGPSGPSGASGPNGSNGGPQTAPKGATKGDGDPAPRTTAAPTKTPPKPTAAPPKPTKPAGKPKPPGRPPKH